jgi:hypothetical protein
MMSCVSELLRAQNFSVMACSGPETREYGRRDPQKLILSGGRSVRMVRSRTQAMEFVILFLFVLFVMACNFRR